jgi:cell division protein FtsZ
LRGARYQGAFIPPQAIDSGRDANTAYQNWTGGVPAQQTQVQTQVQAQVAPQYQADTDVAVAPQAEVAPRRKSPSLFDRITGGIRREIDAVRSASREELSFADEGNQKMAQQTSAAATRKAPELPQQGRLNIDAPAAVSAGDSELEIPAFLRRQAN